MRQERFFQLYFDFLRIFITRVGYIRAEQADVRDRPLLPSSLKCIKDEHLGILLSTSD